MLPLLAFVTALLPAQAPELVAGATPHAFTIQSPILGQARRLVVTLPPSFERTSSTRRYPLIIVFDGEGSSATAAVSVATELARHGLIPECVIVGIENLGGARGRVHDLTPPGLSVSGSGVNEGGETFLRFIEQELIPAVDRRFRTTEPRTLIGHSSGGILATYAAASRSTFRLIAALDTPATIGNNWLLAKLTARAKASPTPLRYVSYGARFGWPPELWSRLTASAPPGWVLHNEHLARESHGSMPMLGAYLGLRELFADYSRVAAPELPSKVIPFYESLTSKYGAPLDPPESLIRDVIDDLLVEGRGAEAKVAFDRLAAAYGDPGAALRTKVEEAARRPSPSDTVESLLATPFPTPDAVAGYVGEWSGESWMEGGARRTFTLVIAVENGRVTGRVIQQGGQGPGLVRPLEYLAVTTDGLTYGFMNGMRPRVMILFPLRRTGDRLEGMMRWGGFDTEAPDGAPPPMHVELRKTNIR